MSATGAIVLEGENLTRRIAGREIVAGVSITLEAGESLSLVGPSGCGKTSLLQVLGLLDRPDEGSVKVLGETRDVWSVGESQRARTRLTHIGFVFQQHNLFEAMTAIENVALPAWRKTGSRAMAMKRATELLEQLGLARVAHSRAAELSGGEAQRTAIARAIINDPKIILADEPTGNLDSASTQVVMEMLYGVCERGTALLVVTHDLDVAARASRKIGMLDGRIVRPSQAPPSLSWRPGRGGTQTK